MTATAGAGPKHWTARRAAICLAAAARRLIANGGLVAAGHMAFVGLLALFPFLIFLTALAGFLGQTETGTHFVAFLFEQMPEQVSAVLLQPLLEVLQETRGGLLTIGIVTSIWTASSGLEAARISLNRACLAQSRRPFLLARLESALLVVLASALIVVAMLALVLGPVAWQAAQDYLRLPESLRLSWVVARYGVGALLLWLAVAGLYFLLPAVRLKARWVLPGTLLVVLLWLAAATGFSLYVARFGSYTVTYGSLAGIIVTLLFFYVLATVFIYGAEVCAALARAEGGLPPPRRRQEDSSSTPPRRRAEN